MRENGSHAAVETTEKLQKERSFNPYRRTRTAAAKALVAEVLCRLDDHETATGVRKRKRRVADRQSHEEIVEALVCDLLHQQLRGSANGVRITQSRQILGRSSRYRPQVFTTKLPDIISALAHPDLSMIEKQEASEPSFSNNGKGRQTVIRASANLVGLGAARELTSGDFQQIDGAEIIILKRTKDPLDRKDPGARIEYEDDASTRAFRDRLEEINRWLEAADMECVFHPDTPDRLMENADVEDRRLRRIFTQSRFDSGGRLFGGFWQPMPSEDRKRSILLKGEEVISCDFDQMSVRMLYGRANAVVPDGDLYALPGLEDHREGAKKVINAMLFRDGRLERLPQGCRQLFPSSVLCEHVVSAVEERHAPLKDFLGTNIGHDLQFTESEIMVDTLNELKRSDIIALPVHDAVVAPVSRASRVRDVMLDVFRSHTGVPGGVTME